MLEGTFWYNGRCSDEFNLKIGYTNSNNTFNFGIDRENSVESLPHYYNTYDLGSSYSPLKKSFAIYATKPLTAKKRTEICDWLFVDEFCEFFSQCQPDIVYHCKLEGDAEKWIGCGMLGYIECEMICNAPFAWTHPRIITRYFDRSKIINGAATADNYSSTVEIRNDSNYKSWGDFIFKIHLPSSDILTIPGSTSGSTEQIINQEKFFIKIWNKTNTKEENAFVISSENYSKMPLYYNETLQIDMNSGNIYSDAQIGVGDTYKHRIYNCNRKFLTLNKGLNEIEVSGICDYQVITQFPILH